MISAILIDQETYALQNLLESFFPQVHICGIANTFEKAYPLINKNRPDLVFINVLLQNKTTFDFISQFIPKGFETIYTASKKDFAIEAIRHNATGYVLKPLKREDLIIAVENARMKILEKVRQKKNNEQLNCIISQLSVNNLIGIPTIDGLEFVPINEIIRCEGLQKCTRVITTQKTDIVSSYNIGEFIKLLSPFGFYAPHKSHLINLKKINRYKRCGTIFMMDNSFVPVARRRRGEFLQHLTCIRAGVNL